MTKNTNIRIGGNYIQQVFRWQSMVSKHPGPQINISEPFRYFGKEEMKKIKATLPTSFDWRLQNNQKGEPLLLTTREQLTCGSCYAFCAVQMLSHRISIATKGEKKPVLSPQDIISNGKRFIDENFIKPKNPSETTQLINEKKITRAINYFIDGCDGGLLISTVNYLVMKGVPLESIVPYANAELSSITASPNYYNRNDLERFYAMSSHSLVANLEAGLSADTIRLDPETLEFNNLNMMYAIVNHGPIITALNIFTDFFYYPNTGPVYEKQDYLVINGTTITSVFEGGHAVVLVGFGEWENEDGSKTPYWIGQNSWGVSDLYVLFYI